jgi:hypothetical protein
MQPLDFEIDALTNSIENTSTGEVFDTEVVLLKSSSLNEIKKSAWLFDWKREIEEVGKDVYKVVARQRPKIIHGLISITDNHDHIVMHLIESAKFNKGKNKEYKGVAGNLVAFCCKLAFEKGYDGVVAFVAKTQLIEHYKQTLGAKQFSGNRMFIDTREAVALVRQYFKNFKL